MNQIKVLTYSLDFAVLNKYLKFIMQSVRLKIFNEKAEVLFNFLFYRISSELFYPEVNYPCFRVINLF